MVIEGIQKCLDHKFTPEEIESGILKDLIIEEDYNLSGYYDSSFLAFEHASFEVLFRFPFGHAHPLNHLPFVER